MGFYIRKSKNFGPFRLNFSKSGIGVSAGVKGARISTGPNGTYLNAGTNGIYYRKKLGSKKTTNSKSLKRNNKNTYITNYDLAKKKNKDRAKGKSLIKYAIFFVCILLFATFIVCLTEGAKVKDVVSISTIAYAKIIIGLILDAKGRYKNNPSYVHFGRGEIVSGLICYLCSMHKIFMKTYSSTFRAIVLVALIVTALIVVVFVIKSRKFNSINIVDNELDRMTYDVQFANRIPVVITLIAYLILIGLNYAVAISDKALLKTTLIAEFVCAIIYFVFRIVGKVQLDYELDIEQIKKWNTFVDSFEVLLDSDKIYAMCSPVRRTTDVYNYPTKIFKSLGSQATNVSHSKANVRSIELIADGIKCIFLPDRILATDYFNTESFYYADLLLRNGEDGVSGDKEKLGNDSIFESFSHLYENNDGSRDKRRTYNPMYFTYKLGYLEFCDDNFWLKISASKTNIFKAIVPNIESYISYAKENINLATENNDDDNSFNETSVNELTEEFNNKEINNNTCEEDKKDIIEENNDPISALGDLVNNIDNLNKDTTVVEEKTDCKEKEQKTKEIKNKKNKLLSDLIDNTNVED